MLAKTNAVKKLGDDFEKEEEEEEKQNVNGPGRYKIRKGRHFWQWAKHAWL